MADQQLEELTPIASPHSLDQLYVNDVSDLTDDGGGTGKLMTIGALLGGATTGQILHVNSDGAPQGDSDLVYDGDTLTVSTSNTTATVAIFQGAPLQTGNLTEWRDSSNLVLSLVNAAGKLILDNNQTYGNTTGVAFGDGDTCIYENADDNLYIGIANSVHTRFDSSGMLINSLNGPKLMKETPSSNNPVFTFDGDDDTGMGRAGANTLNLITGGTSRFQIASSGEIATGGLVPVSGQDFTVHNATGNSVLVVSSQTDDARLVLNSNVDGLGTENSFVFFQNNGSDIWRVGKSSSNDYEIYNSSVAATVMSISDATNLTTFFDGFIVETDEATPVFFRSATSPSTQRIYFEPDGSGHSYAVFSSSTPSRDIGITLSEASSVAWAIWTATNSNDFFVGERSTGSGVGGWANSEFGIRNTTGQVGIGGIEPTDEQLLVVAGDATYKCLTLRMAATHTENAMEIQDSSSTVLASVSSTGQFVADAGLDYGTATGIAFGDGDTRIYEFADDRLIFETGGVEAFRVNNLQRVSFGTTAASSTVNVGGDRVITFQGGNGSLSSSAWLSYTAATHVFNSGDLRINADVDGAAVNIKPKDTTERALAIQQFALGLDQLIKLEDSGGSEVGGWHTTGVMIGSGSPSALVHAEAFAATDIVSIFQGTALQTGNLTEWRDSADAILTSVDAAGQLTVDANQAFGVGTGIAFGDGDTGFYQLADDVLVCRAAGVTTFQVENGVTKHPSGSAAAPGISFINATGSGFYRSGNDIRISHNGGWDWSFEADTFASSLAGGPAMRSVTATATVPVFVMADDTDTGIGSAGANFLSLISGGVEGFRVADNRDVAMGLSGGTSATTAGFYFDESTPNVRINSDAICFTMAGVTDSNQTIIFRPSNSGQCYARFTCNTSTREAMIGYKQNVSGIEWSAGLAAGDDYFIAEKAVGSGTTGWNLSQIGIRHTSGMVGIGGIEPSNEQLLVVAGDATYKALVLQGAVSHSARLFECRNSSSTVLMDIDAAGQITLDVNTAYGTTTGLMFGDGDTGFYESADDTLIARNAGITRGFWSPSGYTGGGASTYGGIRYSVPSAANPSICPEMADSNTGLGHPDADELSVVTGGRETLRLQSGTVNTTDATVTTAATYGTSTDVVVTLMVFVKAYNTTDYTEGAGYVLSGTFRNDGGVLSQVGSTSTNLSAEDTAGWDCVLDTSGTDVRVRVTGAVATNVTWDVSILSM